MRKTIHFDNFDCDGWPAPDELGRFFLAPKGQEWSFERRNVRGIDPEDPRESESLQSRAAAALRDWDGNDRRSVLAYLNELLNGRHSDAELHYVWRAQSPGYDFSLGSHRVFFEELRRQIIERQRKPA